MNVARQCPRTFFLFSSWRSYHSGQRASLARLLTHRAVATSTALYTPPALSQKRSCGTMPSSSSWQQLLDLNRLPPPSSPVCGPRDAHCPLEEASWSDAVQQWWGRVDKTDDGLPYEGTEVAVLVQALAMTLHRLQQQAGGEASAPEEPRRSSLMPLVREMEAVMVYVVRTRLRYFTLVRQPVVPGEQQAQTEEEGEEDGVVAERRVAPVDRAAEEARALALHRGNRERIKDLVEPYHDTELLQLTVLVETIQTVLRAVHEGGMATSEGDDPAGLSHRTRSVLYSLAVTTLAAVEQLPAPTLATLATCLAQCAESYAVTLQLGSLRCRRNEKKSSEGDTVAAATADDDDNDESLTPAFFLRDESGDSQELVEERQRMKQLLGGMTATVAVKPVEVLAHFSLLAAEAQKRMGMSLASPPVAAPEKESGESRETFSIFWKRCRPHNDDDDEADDKAAKDAAGRSARLGLRSLADRKAVERQRKRSNQGRPRRTANARDEGEGDSRRDDAMNDANRGTLQLSLTDVSELCTAMAAMGHRADRRFWHSVTRYTAWCAFNFAQELDTQQQQQPTGSDGYGGDGGGEIELNRFLLEMRDVAFALSFVHRHDDYDTLMEALVRLRFLAAPIPNPSAVERSMQERRGWR